MGAPKRRNIETPEVGEIWFQFRQQQSNRKDSKGKREIEAKSLSSATNKGTWKNKYYEIFLKQ